MKNILIALTFASLTLFTGVGTRAESPPLAALTAAALAPSAAAVSTRMAPIQEPKSAVQVRPQMQMAVIGIDGRSSRNASDRMSDRADRTAEPARDGGIPSTASGLAAVLLMICILISRRNKHENV